MGENHSSIALSPVLPDPVLRHLSQRQQLPFPVGVIHLQSVAAIAELLDSSPRARQQPLNVTPVTVALRPAQ